VTVTGCNWCGNGVRPRDPVGDAEPTKTAETRSARRAWKKLAGAARAGHVQHPAVVRMAEAARTDDDDSIGIEEMVQESQRALAAHNERHRMGTPIMALGAGGDEYSAAPAAERKDALSAPSVVLSTSAQGATGPTSPADAGGSVFLPDGGPPASTFTGHEYSREELDAVPVAEPPALALDDKPRARRNAISEGR
jgi:hypothetical protein